MPANSEEQEDELLALQSIFDPEEFVRNETKSAGEIRACVELPTDFTVALREGDSLRQYEISFLPPLLLTFELPADYPSSSPPSFTLTCSWLTDTQLSALAVQLTDLYQATGGAVVLYTWVQFLKEDALGFLDIHTLLELPSDEHSTQNESQDSLNAADFLNKGSVSVSVPSSSSGPLDQSEQGASSLPIHPRESTPNKDQTPSPLCLTPSQALLSQLLIYNATQQQKQFATTGFDCGVCFMRRLGSDCVQLPECGHIFCRACLGQFCKLQITDGNVQGVTCPQAECTATPTPAQVRSLVGEELFSRYDRLLLQNTLDCMSDIVYCPRRSCGSAVIQEKSSKAAMCSACSYAFCVVCRKTYHGTEDCQRKKNVTEIEGIKALWDDYSTGSKQRRKLLESRYGRNTLQVTVSDCLSENWKICNSKTCPHCFSRIQKNGGCNMMTCSQCRQMFCWVCTARLPSVHAGSHFAEGTCNQSFSFS